MNGRRTQLCWASRVAIVQGTGTALIELLTLTQQTVPCTGTYRPGQLRLRVLWPVYLTVWSLVTYALPRVAISALGDFERTAALVGTLTGAWLALRVWRLKRVRQLRGSCMNHRLHRLDRLIFRAPNFSPSHLISFLHLLRTEPDTDLVSRLTAAHIRASTASSRTEMATNRPSPSRKLHLHRNQHRHFATVQSCRFESPPAGSGDSRHV